MSAAISVKGVSKRYRIGLVESEHKTFAGQLVDMVKTPFTNLKKLRSLSSFKGEDESIFWALKDISFEVQEGEVLGIIGHNGAGKSTLLKILSRITEPTSGEITIKGRVSSLLEVGTGFHPDLTGRENIYMNGTILGMKKKEIDHKLEEIIAFSGVSQYIDTPVKRYSSGMKVRLAFSVAAHLEPDVLIIDEVLAVGDAEFQKKCLGKMEEVAGLGRTVLFVSHDLTAVRNLCKSVILLTGGSIENTGFSDEIVNYYYNKSATGTKLSERKERRGKGDFRFVDYSLIGQIKKENLLFSGESVDIELQYEVYNDFEQLKSPHIAISISHSKYGLITSLSNLYSGDNLQLINPKGKIVCHLNELTLLPGMYYITLFCSSGNERQDVVYNAISFEVLPRDVYGSGKMMDSSKQGIFYMGQKWQIQ